MERLAAAKTEPAAAKPERLAGAAASALQGPQLKTPLERDAMAAKWRELQAQIRTNEADRGRNAVKSEVRCLVQNMFSDSSV